MTSLLDTITQLSHEFGSDEYVKAGGGNTSCKTDDTLWVKPSGTTLAALTPQGFVALDRARLADLYTAQTPDDAAAREELVKNMMAAAVKPRHRGARRSRHRCTIRWRRVLWCIPIRWRSTG